MSRFYGMNVTISGHNPAMTEKIKTAAGELWDFEDWHDGDDGSLSSYGENSLCGGET